MASKQKSIYDLALKVFLILWVLFFSAVVFIKLRHRSQIALLRETAALMGTSQEDEIVSDVQYFSDFVSASKAFLYLRTDLDKEGFERKLRLLDWKDSFVKPDYSGMQVFLGINNHTRVTLTIDGSDPTHPPDMTKEFDATSWSLRDKHNRLWFISFYPLKNQKGDFAIDGRLTKQNIIGIELRTW